MDIIFEKPEFFSVIVVSLLTLVFTAIYFIKRKMEPGLVLFLSFLMVMAITFLSLAVVVATSFFRLSEEIGCFLIGGIFFISIMLIKKGSR